MVLLRGLEPRSAAFTEGVRDHLQTTGKPTAEADFGVFYPMVEMLTVLILFHIKRRDFYFLYT